MIFRPSKAYAACIGVFLLVTGLLVTGCQARGLPAPAKPPREGQLRVLLPFEPQGLEPLSPGDEAAIVLASNLYSKLVAFDAEGRLFPDLAESWSVSEGGLLYTFHLRPGVRWHDGKPLTSADVEWTFERLAREPGFAAEAIRRITRVEAVDDTTVVIRLKEPWAPFLSTLCWFGGFILPRHHPTGLAERPVGTGPFRFGEWVRGDHLTLVANPDFFRPGPYLERIVYTFSPDSRLAAEKLLAGTVDFTLTRPASDLIPRLEKEPGIRTLSLPSESRLYCAFNLRRRPLADLRVREAINRTLDRQEILERALHGFGSPALGFYTPAVGWAYNGNAHVPPHDLERARELLAAAGHPALRLELVTMSADPHREVARLVAEQLAAVGIEARLSVVPLDRFLERVMKRHDFDIALTGGSHGPDPENMNLRFGTRGSLQLMGYSSAELDAAVAEGARTLDLAQRAQAYFRAQEILARDLPIAPVVEGVHLSFFSARVHGLPQAEARGLVPVHEYSLVRVEPAS